MHHAPTQIHSRWNPAPCNSRMGTVYKVWMPSRKLRECTGNFGSFTVHLWDLYSKLGHFPYQMVNMRVAQTGSGMQNRTSKASDVTAAAMLITSLNHNPVPWHVLHKSVAVQCCSNPTARHIKHIFEIYHWNVLNCLLTLSGCETW
jgi:hypothetical protein